MNTPSIRIPPARGKLAVFLGGPFHGRMEWVARFDEFYEVDESVEFFDSAAIDSRVPRVYRFAFADEHIGIYFWRLNDFQIKTIRQQVVQLRIRHGELAWSEE